MYKIYYFYLFLKKLQTMIKAFYISLAFFLLVACATQVPYTNQIRDEFSLDSAEKLSKVQFFISSTIVMDEVVVNDNQGTTSNGTLVNSSNTKKESIIIQAGTPCLFDDFGPKGEMMVRFETGDGRVLKFVARTDSQKRYYLDADWSQAGGAKIKYGEKSYKINMQMGNPRSAYLRVAKRKLERIRRKSRAVRGLKI